jgi:hypothetical protein
MIRKSDKYSQYKPLFPLKRYYSRIFITKIPTFRWHNFECTHLQLNKRTCETFLLETYLSEATKKKRSNKTKFVAKKAKLNRKHVEHVA